MTTYRVFLHVCVHGNYMQLIFVMCMKFYQDIFNVVAHVIWVLYLQYIARYLATMAIYVQTLLKKSSYSVFRGSNHLVLTLGASHWDMYVA